MNLKVLNGLAEPTQGCRLLATNDNIESVTHHLNILLTLISHKGSYDISLVLILLRSIDFCFKLFDAINILLFDGLASLLQKFNHP